MTQIPPNNTFRSSSHPDIEKRASRYRRPKPIPMHLTERDEQIIVRCWEDKVMSTSDLHTLFFGARARCIYRLRILYSNNYLDRYFLPLNRPYRGSNEALYTIGAKGNSIVSLRLGQEMNYVALKRREFNIRMGSPSFLLTFRHLRTVSHTRICFEKAFRNADDWQLVRWVPERLLEDQFLVTSEGQVKRTKIRADGFLQYQHRATGRLISAFVEADLGTMSHCQITAKVQRYLNYFQTELPLQKYGSRWFRVLMIVPSHKRAIELKQTMTQLTSSIFWLTTYDDLTHSSWLKKNIWLRVGKEGYDALVE